MNLPVRFCEKMHRLLKDDYEEFIEGYNGENHFSLRVNTIKANVDQFCAENLFDLEKVDWCPTGFYYNGVYRPGKHPYHRAGVYYIQEASAMGPVVAAEIEKGDKVLDLCAAPGGKSSGAAAALNGSGILVTNEIVSSRAKILSSNLERMGVRNAVVTNESPADLEKFFPGYFDKIIVDAPCSGEGMFRKDPKAAREWSPQAVEACAIRQRLILESADKMLAPGGKIIYSTCTFSPEENEMTVADFVRNHPEYTIIKPEVHHFFSPGRPDWADGNPRLENTMRLFPYKLKGEGHYIAVMQKNGGQSGKVKCIAPIKNRKVIAPWDNFRKSSLNIPDFENYLTVGNTLYAMPSNMPDFSKIKVLRAGLRLGEIKKDRFEPDHSLAMALKPSDAFTVENLDIDDPKVNEYLTGQQIETINSYKGYRLIAVNGYTIGWGKSDGNVIKNHYPKGLRILG